LTPAKLPPAHLFTADDLIKHKLPPREPILELVVAPPEERTVIWEGGLIEVVGGRGVGKSMFMTGLALALSTGGRFLHWRSPKPRKVVIVDGEMDGREQQFRLRDMMPKMSITTTHHNLGILNHDWQPERMPRLDKLIGAGKNEHVAGADLIEPLLDWKNWSNVDDAWVHNIDEPTPWAHWGGSVVILDNASCLFDPSGEMDIDRWQPARDWLLSLRRQGVTVFLLHHMGRDGGKGRGLSTREDILDIVWHLNPIIDQKTGQPKPFLDGSRFQLHFDKGRGIVGKAKEDIEVVTYHKHYGWSFKLANKPVNAVATNDDMNLLDRIQRSGVVTFAELALLGQVMRLRAQLVRLREYRLIGIRPGSGEADTKYNVTSRGVEVVKHYQGGVGIGPKPEQDDEEQHEEEE
jgi:hypothetical protein